MEINKEELQTMLRENWMHNQNDMVETASVIFLRRAGLTDDEIIFWLDLDKLPKITKEDEIDYEEKLQDTKDYFTQ